MNLKELPFAEALVYFEAEAQAMLEMARDRQAFRRAGMRDISEANRTALASQAARLREIAEALDTMAEAADEPLPGKLLRLAEKYAPK